MSINIQGLHDAMFAMIVLVGIGVIVAMALTAAGAFFQGGKSRAGKAIRTATIPAQHPTQSDDTRELVLR